MNRAVPIAADLSTLFREVPLLERFEAARRRGFDGVEIQFPYSERREIHVRHRTDARTSSAYASSRAFESRARIRSPVNVAYDG